MIIVSMARAGRSLALARPGAIVAEHWSAIEIVAKALSERPILNK